MSTLRTLTVGREGCPIVGWQVRCSEAGNVWHQCRAPLAVIGDVWEIKNSHLEDKSDVGLFLWSVRTMHDARPDRTGDGPRGYAATLAAAKEIVEVILHNTGTAAKAPAPQGAPVLTGEMVEEFFLERLNEMQTAVPEYATLSLGISRHVYDGKVEPAETRWQGYLTSGNHFPSAPFNTNVKLEQVMEHVTKIAKDRKPENMAAKMRAQAAHLVAQAEQLEKNAGGVVTPAGSKEVQS